MISGLRPLGYTIVEVMIFLAVSGVLLTSTMLVVEGQQNKTQFRQSARDFESRMNDIANDVATGFYPSTGKIKCVPRSGPVGSGITLSVSVTNTEQGTNGACTFIGRVVQFGIDTKPGTVVRIYPVAGQRLRDATHEVDELYRAKGQLVATGLTTGTSAPDAYEQVDLGAVKIGKVSYTVGASPTTTSGIGFFTSFSGYTGNSLNSGSTSTDLVAIPPNTPSCTSPCPVTPDQDPKKFVDSLNTLLSNSNINDTKNPPGGVSICLLSLGTNMHAVLKMGGGASPVASEMTFGSGNQPGNCP